MSKPQTIIQELALPDGRKITIETGALAKFANGAVTVRLGDTVLFAVVNASKEPKEGIDFLPLTVDYQEKYASTGRYPGGFIKRETRPSDHEILISRLIDRAFRPLFPDNYHFETQIMVQLYSADLEVAPDSLAGLAASAAIACSDVPFPDLISEVRVARIGGELVINPSVEALKEADIDLLVAGTKNDINMVEGEMNEVSEQEMLEAIQFAHSVIRQQVEGLEELRNKVGKTPFEVPSAEEDEMLRQQLDNQFRGRLIELARTPSSKEERSSAFSSLFSDHKAEELEKEGQAKERGEEVNSTNWDLAKKYYGKLKKEVIRDNIISSRQRLDGRALDEIRPIWSEVDVLPRTHGSAIFSRGETQALTTVTLGTKMDEQLIDGALYKGSSRFLLQYTFPAFSVGEVRPNRGPSRREVGHGNLALRALKAALPEDEDNPYTIRITSDVLESNGSSSMATVCAGTLALMDAGIKLSAPVSGIAMGLIQDKGGRYAVLSDILGDEDHLGDMDFKVTGTEKGITACQMDLKIDGLDYNVLAEALEQARQGRLHILHKMNETMSAPREDYKAHVPRMVRFEIPTEFIGAVIGSGGKVIQKIQKETGTVVTVDEADGVGIVAISGTDPEAVDKAHKWVVGITTEPELNKTYQGKVVSLQSFGAFVEILPGKDGLLHISEISFDRVENVEDVLSVGDEMEVKLIEIDEKSGKLRLSRKALLTPPEGQEYTPSPSPGRGGRGGNDRRGGGRDRDSRGGGRGGNDRRDNRGGGDGDRNRSSNRSDDNNSRGQSRDDRGSRDRDNDSRDNAESRDNRSNRDNNDSRDNRDNRNSRNNGNSNSGDNRRSDSRRSDNDDNSYEGGRDRSPSREKRTYDDQLPRPDRQSRGSRSNDSDNSPAGFFD